MGRCETGQDGDEAGRDGVPRAFPVIFYFEGIEDNRSGGLLGKRRKIENTYTLNSSVQQALNKRLKSYFLANDCRLSCLAAGERTDFLFLFLFK